MSKKIVCQNCRALLAKIKKETIYIYGREIFNQGLTRHNGKLIHEITCDCGCGLTFITSDNLKMINTAEVK